MSFCQRCGKPVEENLTYCPHCGAALTKSQPKNEWLAAVLSFLWTGLGQIYIGQIGRGIGMVIGGIVFTIISWFLFWPAFLIFWGWSIYDAYNLAKKYNQGLIVPAMPPQIKREEPAIREQAPIYKPPEVAEPHKGYPDLAKEIEKYRTAISVLDSQFATKQVSEESYRMAKTSLEKKLQDLLKHNEDLTKTRKQLLELVERRGNVGKADILRDVDVSSEVVDEAFRQLEKEGIIEETSGQRYKYKGTTKQCPYCKRTIPADLPVCPMCGAVIG